MVTTSSSSSLPNDDLPRAIPKHSIRQIPPVKAVDVGCGRWPFRRRHWWVWTTIVAVALLLGRNLYFYPSTVADDIPEDFYVISYLVTKNITIDNETEIIRNIVDRVQQPHLPPPPWPIETDGCYAEDGTRPFCQFHKLLIDLSRVESTSLGGEYLFPDENNNHDNETRYVMGQTEEDEYLAYRPGAFQLFTNRNTTLPTDFAVGTFKYVTNVLNALQIIHANNINNNTSNNDAPLNEWNCSSYYAGTTLFIQRYEYVNLYHTLTDWWNTWTVYRHFQPHDIANVAVVFLDAHPHGTLDAVWTTLFGTSIHLRRLGQDNVHTQQQQRQNSQLCFERAMLVPPGYISLLWPEEPPMGGMYDSRPNEMMNDFVDFVLHQLNLTHVRKIPGHVVLIDRKPYIAHARSQSVDDRIIHNLPEVADALLQNIPNVTSVRIVQLHDMTFLEQVEAVREAEVLVGVHGAGLTHLVFMDRASHVVEFQMSLNFFVHLAQCKHGQVTLHQIPFLGATVSEFLLHQHFLPTFSKIYERHN